MTRRTRTRSAAIAVVAAVALTACGGGSDSSSAGGGSSEPVMGGDLTIARAADAISMDKTTTFDNNSIYVMQQMMQPLFTVSEDGSTVEPLLATGYEVSEDQLTYTITLRDDVTFSNGDPLTAEDVKFSLDENTATGADGWGFVNAAIDTVEAVDDQTVSITVKYPWAPLIADLSIFANAIIPADYDGQTAEQFYEAPVGTGPFVWDEWQRGQYLTLTANDSYWGEDGPYLDSVTWTVVPDANTRKLQLQGGQIDIDDTPDWSSFESLSTTPGVTATAFPSTRMDYIAFNQQVEPFQDVHVRRAIAFAIDRESMVDAVLYGNGEPANSLLSPGTPYYDESVEGPTFDLDEARAEMAQSSVPDGFSTSLLIASGDPNQASVAQIMQSQLAELGIDMEIRQLEPTANKQARLASDFDMTISAWTMDIPDPDQWTSFAVDPEGGSHSAFTYWDDPAVIELNQQAQREIDEGTRQDLYTQIQEQAGESAFLAYLYYSPYAYAMTDAVQGFQVTPLGNYPLAEVYKTE
ncbi:ABC transporter substrate-binding protein [Geodermatophilaceae bacterium NBWT11]|nr:ABC transporter substrate-binding protein [Geodermatophilaceae bacterium NBWT11]